VHVHVARCRVGRSAFHSPFFFFRAIGDQADLEREDIDKVKLVI
jgi:hypothetical protein